MTVCVLSGSPKGAQSITFQTVRLLERRFPSCRFETVHVGQRIRALERDLTPALDALARAELVLFCYPVYTFLAPSQLHRFLALLKASGVDLRGKLAAQITTSMHFYDVTAHEYIRENCRDLGLRYLGGLSAEMEDLLQKSGRDDAVRFWNYVLWRAEHAAPETPAPRAEAVLPPYTPSLTAVPHDAGRTAVIVADLTEDDGGLAGMIADFQAASPFETRVVDLAAYPFAGGCLGCFGCAVTGACVYKDGFDVFLRTQIQTADAIVCAFTVRDHSMGARFKLYDDRQFCNGHRTVTAGMPFGYLIRGDYAHEPNLRLTLEARADVGGNFLAGAATDAASVAALAETLRYAMDSRLTLPRTFFGVGGMKIFRDLIWLMRGMMKADHRFYKAHGLYDFPQKRIGTVLKMQLVGALLSSPPVRAKAGGKMTEGMLAPYEKALAQED